MLCSRTMKLGRKLYQRLTVQRLPETTSIQRQHAAKQFFFYLLIKEKKIIVHKTMLFLVFARAVSVYMFHMDLGS